MSHGNSEFVYFQTNLPVGVSHDPERCVAMLSKRGLRIVDKKLDALIVAGMSYKVIRDQRSQKLVIVTGSMPVKGEIPADAIVGEGMDDQPSSSYVAESMEQAAGFDSIQQAAKVARDLYTRSLVEPPMAGWDISQDPKEIARERAIQVARNLASDVNCYGVDLVPCNGDPVLRMGDPRNTQVRVDL